MDKTTPTPTWYARQYEQGMVIDENTGETIAVTYDPKNAAIMAAAHDLRDALQNALDAYRADEKLNVRQIMAALEKAETS